MSSIIRRFGFDDILSVLFIIVAIAAYVHTYSFADTAAVWPRCVIGAFAVLSAFVPLSKLLTKNPE